MGVRKLPKLMDLVVFPAVIYSTPPPPRSSVSSQTVFLVQVMGEFRSSLCVRCNFLSAQRLLNAVDMIFLPESASFLQTKTKTLSLEATDLIGFWTLCRFVDGLPRIACACRDLSSVFIGLSLGTVSYTFSARGLFIVRSCAAAALRPTSCAIVGQQLHHQSRQLQSQQHHNGGQNNELVNYHHQWRQQDQSILETFVRAHEILPNNAVFVFSSPNTPTTANTTPQETTTHSAMLAVPFLEPGTDVALARLFSPETGIVWLNNEIVACKKATPTSKV